MANVKVKNEFIDRHTGFTHKPEEIFEASEERIAEIQSVNPDLIEVLDEQEASEKPVEAPVKRQRRKKVSE